jgi:hypothetical protein
MDYGYDLVEVEHRGGVPWDEAPKPIRWHRCRAQTVEWFPTGKRERCACGATRTDGPWEGRNSR